MENKQKTILEIYHEVNIFWASKVDDTNKKWGTLLEESNEKWSSLLKKHEEDWIAFVKKIQRSHDRLVTWLYVMVLIEFTIILYFIAK